MPVFRPLVVVAALAALAVPRAASAHAALGLGADWIDVPHEGDGELQLTLAVDTPLARHVTLGARFGGMWLPDPDRFGVPIDGRLRIRAGRVYAEGLVGPWIFIDDGDTLRLHAAFGFGVLTRVLSFGFELGWLDHPGTMVGVRVAFPL